MSRDIRQTKEYAEYMSATGWRVEEIDGVYVFIRKLPILGSFIKVQRPQKLGKKWLEKLAKVAHINRAFKVVIEPKNSKQAALLERLKYYRSSPFVPSRTIRLNLSRREKSILDQMEKDARYSIRKSRPLKFQKISDIRKFRPAWKSSVPAKRYVMSHKNLQSLIESFGSHSLLLTSHNKSGKVIAGAIFIMSDATAYYWQAFTNKEGRSALAQYGVVWNGIKWAKKNRAKYFDFEGIYDERFPNKKWKGFTHFKKSFGGKEKEYPGAYKKAILPFL